MRDMILMAIRKAKRGGAHRVGNWTVWCEAYRYEDGGYKHRTGHYIHAKHEDGTQVTHSTPRAAADAMLALP